MKIKKIGVVLALVLAVNATTVLAAENDSNIAVQQTVKPELARAVNRAYATGARFVSSPDTHNERELVRVEGSDGYNKTIWVANKRSHYVGYNFATSGYAVHAVQLLLNHYGYGLNVDALFGYRTQSAIVDFQRRHGLSADGICGLDTWRALVDHF